MRVSVVFCTFVLKDRYTCLGLQNQETMSIKKQYLKKDGICKVTLTLSKEKAKSADKVMLVGDFNGWDVKATPMQKLKNGSFKATLKLEKENEYQFRYFLDDERWENDSEADKYISNGYSGDDNSVLIT